MRHIYLCKVAALKPLAKLGSVLPQGLLKYLKLVLLVQCCYQYRNQ